jgi:formylglycine-generating enzyme required for sulfatase activity
MTGSTDDKRDFFVSFNQADREWATWIAWVLEEAGYSVFFQDWGFKGSFIEQMHQASLRTGRTLVVLSDNYLRSEYARSEAWAALARDPVGREDRAVTVKIGPIGDLGFFSHFAYLDLTNSTEADAERLLLERARKSLDPTYRPKPSTRPHFPGRPATKPPFPASAAGPELESGVEVFRDIDEPWCPELVVIQPGKFMMGSTEPERRWALQQGAEREWVDWEKPQHRVAIAAPFDIGKYQVTRGQFARFVEATGHDMSGGAASADWCFPGFEQTDPHPVVCVSWQDAQAYIRWLSQETGQPYRLLSEAEWEYAARAGTTTRYSWGDDPPTPERANFGMNISRTTEVGAYPPNPWGLYDMYGNVWEWVEDCWNESYTGAPSDGSAWTSGDCSRRVLRGSSWGDYPTSLRSAFRSKIATVFRSINIGFRVARTLR